MNERAETEIRDAASVILLRNDGDVPAVLMGQRGASAAFMPNKFVFPGGALDIGDRQVKLAVPLQQACMTRLRAESDPALAEPLVLAAIREVWEETGLQIGESTTDAAPRNLPADWHSYFATGARPSAAGLRFVFRAITPPGRPRRFDARFFVADAACIRGDIDDFSRASDELQRLQWIALDQARNFDLPFITEVVLAEIEADLKDPARNSRVPFFYNAEGRSNFKRL